MIKVLLLTIVYVVMWEYLTALGLMSSSTLNRCIPQGQRCAKTEDCCDQPEIECRLGKCLSNTCVPFEGLCNSSTYCCQPDHKVVCKLVVFNADEPSGYRCVNFILPPNITDEADFNETYFDNNNNVPNNDDDE
uniref:Granulins domain-containing protein n=1 Tax=Biomphalaria glabrata TaxID=6526 RepID=A0A2C9L1G3_BIOGL